MDQKKREVAELRVPAGARQLVSCAHAPAFVVLGELRLEGLQVPRPVFNGSAALWKMAASPLAVGAGTQDGGRGSKIGKFWKILQIFSGLVLGCIKTKFCKKICV